MSYYESGNRGGVPSARCPSSGRRGVCFVRQADHGAEEMLVGDVIGLCVLPADCVPIDFALVPTILIRGQI